MHKKFEERFVFSFFVLNKLCKCLHNKEFPNNLHLGMLPLNIFVIIRKLVINSYAGLVRPGEFGDLNFFLWEMIGRSNSFGYSQKHVFL